MARRCAAVPCALGIYRISKLAPFPESDRSERGEGYIATYNPISLAKTGSIPGWDRGYAQQGLLT